MTYLMIYSVFSGGTVVLFTCQYQFTSWDWKIPWRRKWQPTPVFRLENSMDRGTLWATLHGGIKSLRDRAHTHTVYH